MNYCVILHNMIIENERKHPVPEVELLQPYHRQGPLTELDSQVPASWASFLAMRQEIWDSRVHQELQYDLVNHLWARKGAVRAGAPWFIVFVVLLSCCVCWTICFVEIIPNLGEPCHKFLYFVVYSKIVPKIGRKLAYFWPNTPGLGSGRGFTAEKLGLPRTKITSIRH